MRLLVVLLAGAALLSAACSGQEAAPGEPAPAEAVAETTRNAAEATLCVSRARSLLGITTEAAADRCEPVGDGPILLTTAGEASEAPLGQVEGTLAIDAETGCVTVSGTPVVWPHGTTATLDPPELRLGTLVAEPGDTIRAEFVAWYSRELLEDLPGVVEDDDFTLVDLCGADVRETAIVFGSLGDVAVIATP